MNPLRGASTFNVQLLTSNAQLGCHHLSPPRLDTAPRRVSISAMGRNKIVKICCIVGFVLAEIYMVFIVLAPYRPGPPGRTRMIIPKEMMPKIEGAVPGEKPPAGVLAMKLAVCAFFFGPFGACVGLGAGLLIEGARQKIVSWRSASRPPE
jgi:hypothetical protein